MTKGQSLRDLTVAAIIESAAAILAERGEAASMEEIASAAGIGRATLYRYFPNRDELLSAMATASVQELAARIKEAALDAVPFEEAIARLARGIIATGSKYAALSGDTATALRGDPDLEAKVTSQSERFRRAIADGSSQENFPSMS